MPYDETIINKTLEQEDHIKSIAQTVKRYHDVLFLGRGLYFPTALEGALKLQELSYLHAHGYPGGELKHGPLALIDHNVMTIAMIGDDHHQAKMLSNVSEVAARSGPVIIIHDENVDVSQAQAVHTISVPHCEDMLGHLPQTIVLQLLSYHVANSKGLDVDKPRNLAKSVTVE